MTEFRLINYFHDNLGSLMVNQIMNLIGNQAKYLAGNRAKTHKIV